MPWDSIPAGRDALDKQYKTIRWDADSGLTPAALRQGCGVIAVQTQGRPRGCVKAEMMAYILRHGQVAVGRRDWFAGHLRQDGIVGEIRRVWMRTNDSPELAQCLTAHETAQAALAYTGEPDFGHTAPDWAAVMELGLPGLLRRARRGAVDATCAAQRDFFAASIVAYEAAIDYTTRLADAADCQSAGHPRMTVVAESLRHLAQYPPATLHQAMQLSFLYYTLQNDLERTQVRTLGALDRLYHPFYREDLAQGRLTQTQARELIRHFLCKWRAMEVFANIPFSLGGLDADGADATNDFSCLLIEEYVDLDIHDPKIHIRYHEGLPEDFLRRVLDAVRRGRSSFLFMNDAVVEKALIGIGQSPRDARAYTIVGCYEPAGAGEVPCSCSGRVNLAKAVEIAAQDGIDPQTGYRLAPAAPAPPETFAQFYDYCKSILAHFARGAMDIVRAYEKCYPQNNPSPFFSATLADCIQNGTDAYAGGAKYNNSSVNALGLATAVDALMAIKQWVFDQKRLSLPALAEIIKNNWQGQERLRLEIQRACPKYGNRHPDADALTVDLTEHIARCVNGKPNGRGGVFRCGLFSIDWNIPFGAKTGATPDSRFAGQPLSKNTSASIAQDRAGVTAHILSATEIDYTRLPNGTVFDLLLHSTAARDDEGISAMLGLLRTYMRRGGIALHGNVLDPRVLRDAQKNPEQYANLQIRLCGWNVYFTHLSREEQDEFIKQAEHQTG